MKTLKEAALAVYREYTRLDRVCNSCKRELFGGEGLGANLFCPDCFEHLPRNDGNICEHCGRSSKTPVKRCRDCDGESFFDAARSPFYYAPPINNMIWRYKYRHRKYLAHVFSVFLADVMLKNFSDAEVAVYVPMRPFDIFMRSFNHGAYLARALSEKTGIPVVDVLYKSKRTKRQQRIGKEARLKNLKSAFNVRNRGLIKGKKVLLVDDVITTGATAEVVARELKRAGAKAVYVLTVASVTDRDVARALGQERSG